MERDDSVVERDLADALRRLNAAAVVPPVDDARAAALMAAFDREHAASPLSGHRELKGPRRDGWYLAGFAAAAAVLIAVGLASAPTGRHGSPSPGGPTAPHTPPPSPRDVRLQPPSDFVIVPGAAGLPPMESGTLVRVDLPVAVLPSLGVTPPSGRGATVTADFIVAQDGLPRAVRVVMP